MGSVTCLFSFFLVLSALQIVHGGFPFGDDKCNMVNSYPPPSNNTIPWETLNLDLPPRQRWQHIVQPRATMIQAAITEVLSQAGAVGSKIIEKLLDKNATEMLSRFPADIADEIRGIAEATNVDVALITVFQMMYEVIGVCTSIVAQGPNGHIYHARNLDFGLFMGWDGNNSTWRLTELIKPLLFNLHVVQNNVNIYNATYFAGFVGLLTGGKVNGFSITVDSRFDGSLDKYLIEWLEGKFQATELSILTRQVMETQTDFDSAVKMVANTPTPGPAYIIIGGSKPGQGAVVTRAADKALDVWTLNQAFGNSSYFLLETNYDHWGPVLPIDNRRGPAKKCLEIIGQNGISLPSLFNVLSARPNLNELTAYTALLDLQTGQYESYVQYCPHPCPLF